MSERLWSVRFVDEKDRYEIVNPEGVVEDAVTIRELTEAEYPHCLMQERIRLAQNGNRVRRFGQILRGEL